MIISFHVFLSKTNHFQTTLIDSRMGPQHSGLKWTRENLSFNNEYSLVSYPQHLSVGLTPRQTMHSAYPRDHPQCK